MDRRKRTQFWGADENDDHLIRQIIAGTKTATACPAFAYHEPDGPYEDGGFEVGDVVDVHDLRGIRRCVIRITEVYDTPFADIPEKLWRGENEASAEAFQASHRACWSDLDVTDDFLMTINHFVLVEVVEA